MKELLQKGVIPYTKDLAAMNKAKSKKKLVNAASSSARAQSSRCGTM